MARGYWGPGNSSCRCCHSGPKDKFYCPPCDHVCKAPLGGTPHCPHCREPMVNMGHRWRPARKGKRSMRHSRPWVNARWATESPGLTLLKRWGAA